MESINIKNTIIQNLISYVTEYDVANKNYLIGHDPCAIKTPPPNRVWNFLIDSFQIDTSSKRLFQSLGSAVKSEDYLNAAVLREEIVRNFNISEELVICRGTRYLTDLGFGLSSSKSQREFYQAVLKLVSEWKLHGLKVSGTIFTNLLEIKNSIYKSDPVTIGEEAADMIVEMKYKHPLLVIWNYLLFFKMLKKSL